VYAGLPLAFSLLRSGKRVHLANLSFAELGPLDRDVWLAPDLVVVTESTLGLPDGFPERVLATWPAVRGFSSTVYAFPPSPH
jgi:hypothetical protein